MADQTRTIEIVVNTQPAVKNIDKLNKSLDKNQEEVKETTDETKKYDKQLDDTSKTTSGMVGQLDKMTGGMLGSIKGMGGMVKGLKSIKVALAATGIGAILILITSLIQSFKRTEDGQDRWNKVLRVTNAILDNFLDILGFVGEGIIDALVNPMETVTKLWEGLKGFFSDPLGSIKAGYEAVKEAISDVVEEIGQDIDAATELADLEAKTNRLERQFWIDRANAMLSVSTLRRQARQESKFTAKERAGFQREALIQLDALAIKEEKIAQNRLAIVQQSNELANSNREALDEEARLQAELINIQIRRQDTARGMERILNQLERQAIKEAEAEKAANQSANDSLNERLELTHELLEIDALINEQLGEEIELEQELAAITEEANEAVIDTTAEATDEQGKLNEALGATGQAAQGVLDIFSGKTTGKDIFKFFLTTLGSILSLTTGGAAGGIFGIIGGLFADGGYTGKGGKYQPAGIVHKGEWVANQELVDNPVTGSIIRMLEDVRNNGLKGYSDGGFVPGPTAQEAQIAQLNQSLLQQQIVLPIEDLYSLDTQVQTIQDRATL